MSFIDNLEKKLKKIDKLNNISDNIHNNIIDNIINNKNYDNLDQINKINIKNQYYNSLPQYEKDYQIINDKYKKLISQFSFEYLELSDFYFGPELPREHYLQSKKDIIELYKLFLFYGMMEPYLNYINKY